MFLDIDYYKTVALRKESVDRNLCLCFFALSRVLVALRKESVDRNLIDEIQLEFNSLSLSARRAWIETSLNYKGVLPWAVALRKESVDRNARKIRYVAPDVSSLSARRAWIETIHSKHSKFCRNRSLSARRAWIETYDIARHT